MTIGLLRADQVQTRRDAPLGASKPDYPNPRRVRQEEGSESSRGAPNPRHEVADRVERKPATLAQVRQPVGRTQAQLAAGSQLSPVSTNPQLVTYRYNVTMAVQSIRFSKTEVHDRLRDAAARRGTSASALAEQLIDEGLRQETHPLVVFRDGPTGRRAALINGPDIWEVVTAIVGSDIPPARREARVADLLGLSRAQVDAAMDYYAEFTDEIDERISFNRAEADRQLGLWEQKQRLLAK